MKDARVRWRGLGGSPSLIVVGNLGAVLLAFLSAPLVARAIGADGRGESAAALAAGGVVPVLLALGLPLEARRVAASENPAPTVRAARDIICCAFVPAVLVAFVLQWTLLSSLDGTTRWITTVYLSLSPLAMSTLVDIGVLLSSAKYWSVLVIRVLQPAWVVVSLLIGWPLGWVSVPFVVMTALTGMVVSTVFSTWANRVSLRGQRAPHRALIGGSISFAGSSAAEVATNRLDQILALPLIGATSAGWYSVASTVATAPLAIGHALGASYFRELSSADAEVFKVLRTEAVRTSITIGLASCGILMALAPVGVPMLFGSQFDHAVIPTVIALAGSTLMIANYVSSLVLAVQRRGTAMTVSQLIALAGGMILLLFLGPAFGASGAAVASTLSYLLLCVCLSISLKTSPFAFVPTARALRLAVTRLIR